MTDREKLCELIEDGRMCPVDGNPFEEEKCMSCKYREDRDCDITRLADYLIANGVTVQKWISAETPPKDWKGEGGYLTNYYVYTKEYGVDIGNYMGVANRWLCMGIPCNVTHWMPLPEPPKED